MPPRAVLVRLRQWRIGDERPVMFFSVADAVVTVIGYLADENHFYLLSA